MNAESFIKEKEITWGKPFSNWNRIDFKNALNDFSDKHHKEHLITPIVSSAFYCQRDIEGQNICNIQCKHCKEYYAPLENKNKSVRKIKL